MSASDPRATDPITNDQEFAELIDYFRGELPARVRLLERCAAEHDLDAVRRIAHQLKGAAPGYGFDDVGRAAKVLEERLIETGPEQRTLDTMRAELDALIGLCRSYYSNSARGDKGPN